MNRCFGSKMIVNNVAVTPVLVAYNNEFRACLTALNYYAVVYKSLSNKIWVHNRNSSFGFTAIIWCPPRRTDVLSGTIYRNLSLHGSSLSRYGKINTVLSPSQSNTFKFDYSVSAVRRHEAFTLVALIIDQQDCRKTQTVVTKFTRYWRELWGYRYEYHWSGASNEFQYDRCKTSSEFRLQNARRNKHSQLTQTCLWLSTFREVAPPYAAALIVGERWA